MVALKDKAKVFPPQTGQRIAIQLRDIGSRYPIGAAGGFVERQPRIFISVDFPEPEAPTIATISPAWMLRVIPFRTSTLPSPEG